MTGRSVESLIGNQYQRLYAYAGFAGRVRGAVEFHPEESADKERLQVIALAINDLERDLAELEKQP